jgi:hypothetical protein
MFKGGQTAVVLQVLILVAAEPSAQFGIQDQGELIVSEELGQD